MEKLEVVANFDWLEKEETVGFLYYDSLGGNSLYSFEYSNKWLRNHPDIILGNDIRPFVGKQYAPENRLFGCFADSLPDYWGKKLIDLKTEQTNNEKVIYKLSDWDYLKGVEDILRIGGFRYKIPETGEYLNNSETFQVPPLLSLKDLAEAARKVEEGEFMKDTPENRWIERLFKPGSSVGGARPKACVYDNNSLYIAKFPSTIDNWNVGRWEYFANRMAKQCGINTTETKIIPFKTDRDIFLSKRFDRTRDGKRIHMSSALNLLGLTLDDYQKEKHGYSEIADLIVSSGTNVEKSLQELYRRIAFSICIGNTDDHLKNHSFLLTKKGWELSPVYDINPTIYSSHGLLINEYSNESNLNLLYKAYKLYKLDEKTAWGIIKDVTRNMKYWEATALQCGLDRMELGRYSKRIENGMKWDFSDGLKR